jgi:uncharacterized protein (DUF697 family)
MSNLFLRALAAWLVLLPAPRSNPAVPVPSVAVPQDGFALLSPFTAVRMRGDVPEVRFEGKWYELVALDGIEAQRILAHAKKAFGELWEKRFAEDLVQVLAGMEHAVGSEVALVLIELESKTRREVAHAPMSAENRRKVRAERNASEQRPRGRRDDDEWPKLSPFTAVRASGEVPEVRFEGNWYELVELDGLPAREILEHCRKLYGRLWEKRFAEDLVQVLAGMEHAVGSEVALVLVERASGARLEVARAPMTAANRGSVWEERNRATAMEPGSVRRAERAHALAPSPDYAFLAAPCAQRWPADEPRIARARAEQDLDELELLLEERYSYRDLRGIDWRAGLDAIRCALPDEVGRGELALRLAKLLALAGDGHSGLDEDLGALVPGGCAPFLLGDVGAGLVAFRAERDEFLDPERPRLMSLDGLPLERWIAAASDLVARGSPAAARFRALRLLRHVDLVRGELGLAPRATLELELAALDGSRPARRSVELAADKPRYGAWPRAEHHRIEGERGGVGYLRLAEMDDSPGFLDGLDAAMQRFRATRGLIIDVRGNGGGRRDALLRLFPYFMGADELPHVANVAAYRLAPGEPAERTEGYLEDRFLFPLSSTRLGGAERTAIGAVATRFRPSWTPPAREFSAWHWLVLARTANPRAWPYTKPVVILLDGGCFSATDVFLAAFAGRPGVTLLGTPSSGGSGRARAYRLANSGIGVRLSSMASFRPDGRSYDGLGVEPEVLVLPAAGDFLGRGDAQLAAALERLR